MKTAGLAVTLAVVLSACATVDQTPSRMTYEELNNFQINCSIYHQQIVFLQSQKHSALDQLLSMNSMAGLTGQQNLSRQGTLNHHHRVANGEYNRMIDYVTSRVIDKCSPSRNR